MNLSLKQEMVNRSGLSILIGGLVGIFLTVSPGGVFMLTVIVISGILLWRFSNPEDRKFILAIFIIGITLRIVICTLLQLFLAYHNIGYKRYEAIAPDLFGDSGWYSIRGGLIAEYLRGKLEEWGGSPPIGLFREPKAGYNFYICALFYYLFGFAQLSVKFINCLLGTFLAIFIYFITKGVFNKGVAKMASFLTMFFPSLFLWSLTNLKELPTIFLLCAIAWATIKFNQYAKLRYIFLILFLVSLIELIRPSLVLPVFASLFFSLLLVIKKRTIWKILIVATLFILMAYMLGYNSLLIRKNLLLETIKRMVGLQRGFVSEGGSTYKIYEERLYNGPIGDIRPLGFLVSFIKGWIYFLFTPFPWSIYTKLQLISYPQVMLWYFLVPFSVLGILSGIKCRSKTALTILIYIFFITSSLALVSGNIGTAIRHRDLILPFYFIFIAAGFVKIFGAKIEFKT